MATNPFFVQPGNDLSQGLSGLSATLSDVRQSRMIEAESARRVQAEEAAMRRREEAAMAAQEAYQSGDPSLMAKASLQYPEIAEGLRSSFGFNEERKAKEAGDFAKRLLLASPEQRPMIYEERINSLSEQGRDPSHTIQSFKDYQANPNGELKALETIWAGVDPKGYSVIADEQKAMQKADLERARQDREDARFWAREAGADRRAAMSARASMAGGAMKPTAGMQDFQYYQNLKKEDPAMAEEFGRERGFISKEGAELSSHLQKRLSVSTDDAIQAENDIGRFETLASEIERSDWKGGLLGGKWGEALKDATGEQDAVTELRKKFNAIKGSQVVNNLPPGAASDADVALAMAGFPTENANKEQIASFMRGLAKVQRINAEFNNFKSEFISDNGSERGMLQAWKGRGGSGSTNKPSSASAPKVGAVMDGYRFLGGNPADPASWEQQ